MAKKKKKQTTPNNPSSNTPAAPAPDPESSGQAGLLNVTSSAESSDLPPAKTLAESEPKVTSQTEEIEKDEENEEIDSDEDLEDYEITWSDQLGDFALKYKWVLLGAIMLLAAALRLFHLGYRSLWYDESFTLTLANRNLPDLLNATAHDYHPPLHYLLFAGWTTLLGDGVVTARLLSLLLGVAAVGVVYGFAQEMFGTRTGLLAAFLAAVAPFQIAYSQEIRHYSLQFLLGTWLLWAFYRAWRRDSWQTWLHFGVVALLALYNLYFSIFQLVILGLFFLGWLLYRYRRTGKWDKRFKGWLVANLCAGLLFLPWAWALVQQAGTVKKSYWIDTPNPLEIFRLTNVFLFNATNLTTEPLYALGGQLLGGLLTLFLLYAVRFRLRTGEKGQRRRSFEVAFLLILWFGTVGLVLLLSYIYTPIYLERSLLGIAGCCYILLARVVQTAKRPVLWLFLLLPSAVVLLGSLQAYYFSTEYTVHYENNRMVAAVQAEYKPGDSVIHSSKLSFLPFARLNAPGSQWLIPEEPGNIHDDLSETTQKIIGLQYTPLDRILTQAGPRLWWVRIVPQPGQTEKYLNEAQLQIEQNYTLQKRSEFWGGTLYLYVKK